MMAFKWSKLSETCCVLSSPGDLNKSGVCFLVKHSESRDMRPRHCVWKCCGDANVTRCCPLSHVTSVIDAEWFWKWSGVRRTREGTGRRYGGEKAEGNDCQLDQECPVWWERWSATCHACTVCCLDSPPKKNRKNEKESNKGRTNVEPTDDRWWEYLLMGQFIQ